MTPFPERETVKCRICGKDATKFMTFGRMPIANGFLRQEEFPIEYFYQLSPSFCERCFTFQIEEQPDPQQMFHENYAFYTRSSQHMQRHFRDFANWAMHRFLDRDDDLVVELGSNDGAMLENFAKRGIRHLGIEPSANVAAVASDFGVDTEVCFFGRETARRLRKEYGSAKIVLAANVICHIPDLSDLGAGLDLLLASDGLFIFEEPYLGSMIERVSYDQIYDEHVYIFSALSVKNIFEPLGFEVVDLLPQKTHGGSMRYVLARKGVLPASKAVANIFKAELRQNLHSLDTCIAFASACEASRERLVDALMKEKSAGRRVVGYGATSKSTTILNYCGIGPELIDYICDTSPTKHGKFSPGMHIPIRPYETFSMDPPQTALLLAWNHSKEILAKESAFTEAGGRWLTHLQAVENGN